MKIIGIIPARYASTRFPGKPLVDIDGKPMIQRVYEQALKAPSLQKVVVATDDERIGKVVEAFGGNVCYTASTHQSGTDRCAEVVTKEGNTFDVAINIQGDEPFIQPEQIELLASCFKKDGNTQIATLAKEIIHLDDLLSPNCPKIVFGENQHALYFSRSAIPFCRNCEPSQWLQQHKYYKHIGLYGYSISVLREIAELKPSALEQIESLEQLRWLEHGYQIKISFTTFENIAIDTPEDLNKIK